MAPEPLSRQLRRAPAEGESLSTHKLAKPDYRIDPETGCWVWLKFKLRGYGRNTASGHSQYAHRAYYELVHGPVPDGYHVHHRCENPSCVNPDHLEAATATNHFLGHMLNERTGLTIEDVKAIRELRADPTVSAAGVAAQYGVHEITVYEWWSGAHWPEHLGGPAPKPLRICPWCEQEFDNKRRDAKFCCAQHRTNFNTRRRIQEARQVHV